MLRRMVDTLWLDPIFFNGLIRSYTLWLDLSLVEACLRPTFSSITAKPKTYLNMLKIHDELVDRARVLIDKYIPNVQTIPLHQGMEWKPTWKSLPNMVRDAQFLIHIG